jgi:hypothetical protein
MKTPFYLYLSLLAVCCFSCSKTIEKSNTAPTSFATPQAPENQSAQTDEINSSIGQKGAVLFDGKNYIRKSGWLTPSRNNTYVDDTYVEDAVKGKTRAGKAVKLSTISFIYKIPWIYSQDFSFDGSGLDDLKGKIESDYFRESRANGKIFMYTISGKRVTGLPANFEPHDDPFVYQIQDRDGDGKFETLLGGSQDIIVPNWVLK